MANKPLGFGAINFKSSTEYSLITSTILKPAATRKLPNIGNPATMMARNLRVSVLRLSSTLSRELAFVRQQSTHSLDPVKLISLLFCAMKQNGTIITIIIIIVHPTPSNNYEIRRLLNRPANFKTTESRQDRRRCR